MDGRSCERDRRMECKLRNLIHTDEGDAGAELGGKTPTYLNATKRSAAAGQAFPLLHQRDKRVASTEARALPRHHVPFGQHFCPLYHCPVAKHYEDEIVLTGPTLQRLRKEGTSAPCPPLE